MEPQRAERSPSVAVVGTGQWGLNHVRAWSALRLLTAVCDMDERRLAAAAAVAPEARATPRYDDVLEATDVDAIVLAVPAALHEEMALAALAAGKHILVEKPLALTAAGGARIRDAARQSGRIAAVGHLLEYHPAFLEIRRMLAAGELGRLQYVYSHRLNIGRVRTEENALWSFAPHDIALTLRLTGEAPATVACHGGSFLGTGVADVTTTHLTFPSGVMAHVFVSWLHPFKEHRFVVIGSEGMAVFDDTRDWPEKLVLFPHAVTWEQGQVPVAKRAAAVAVDLAPVEPLRAECEAFARAVREGEPPLVDVATGVAVLDVLERAEASLSDRDVRSERPTVFVHPTATIDDDVALGDGTKVWHHVHISPGASVGARCTLGQNVYVGPDVRIGDDVRVQNNVSVYEGVELEDGVFCGPSMVFTNVKNPRARVDRREEFGKTLVREGASLGASCTIICGVTIGRAAMVAAGAVVTKDVADHALVAGVPARRIGWVCGCGERLEGDTCGRCGATYDVTDEHCVPRDGRDT